MIVCRPSINPRRRCAPVIAVQSLRNAWQRRRIGDPRRKERRQSYSSKSADRSGARRHFARNNSQDKSRDRISFPYGECPGKRVPRKRREGNLGDRARGSWGAIKCGTDLFKRNRSLLMISVLLSSGSLGDKFALASGSSARLRAGNGTRPKIKSASRLYAPRGLCTPGTGP